MATLDTSGPSPIWGYSAIAVGAVALVLAMLVIFAGPFAPQPSVGTTIGEIAADIAMAARNSVQGVEQPAPVPRGWSIDRILQTLTPILGAVAVILAIVAAMRHEPKRAASYGAALGGAAVMIQFVWWIALLICGVVLLMSILQNLGGILEGFGG